MRIQRFLGGILAMAAIVAAVILYNVQSVRSSDHQDSPVMIQRPGADITDVFAYPSPNNPANVVLQMDIHPLIPPSQVNMFALDSDVLYQFRIAHGSYAAGSGFSAKADDTVIQIKADVQGQGQRVSVYGPAAPPSGGTSTSQTLLPAAAGSVAFNDTAGTPLANGMKVFVGVRADPFFFDLFQFFKIIPDRDFHNHPDSNPSAPPSVPAPTAASFNWPSSTVTSGGVTANNCIQAPSSDALGANHFNVIAIVIEAPKALLASSAGSVIGVHATSSTQSGR